MPKPSKGTLKSLPRICCDFNSVGWSGEDDDECFYSFDEKALAACKPREGLRIFIFEKGQGEVIMGCEAMLESYPNPVSGQPKWRLRPVHDTGYFGNR